MIITAESAVAEVTHFVEKLVDAGITYVGRNVPCELEDFEEKIHPQLLIAIKASKITADIPGLEPWLKRLKNTYDEAENILDKIEYETIANKVKHDNKNTLVRFTSLPLIKCLVDSSDKDGRKFHFSSFKKWKLRLRINKLKKDVKELADMAKDFNESLANKLNIAIRNENTTDSRKTTSTPDNKLLGRNKEYERIVNFLLAPLVLSNSKMSYSVLSNSNTSYSVGAILGLGGLGKTTLAKHVYNDHRVVQTFDMRIWVSLEGKLEVTRHTKAMIESASFGRDCPQQSTLEGLQSILMEKLSKSERTLLLLDDVWYNNNKKDDEDREWDKLFAPLGSAKGLKVQLTSCSSSLPRVLKATTCITLRELEHADRISLFSHYAGLDGIESPFSS